jgi:LysR family hydrogen peroxide-inducible transcriptional activator
MITIQQMQYILALSEQLSFQRAAEQCFVTQPTLSMQIRKAEEILGFPVFDRSRSPLELTFFGKELLPILSDIMDENQKIKSLQLRMSGHYVEDVRVGIIPTIASYLVSDMFQIWKEKLEDVHLQIIELTTNEAIEALEKKEIDAAIIAGPYVHPGWRTTKLFKEEILVFAPNLENDFLTQEDLNGLQPWLLSKGNCLRNQMVHFCRIDDGTKDEWDYQGGNLDLLMRMVEINGGYTLIPFHYRMNEVNKRFLKSLQTSNQTKPAREIIALVPNKSIKMAFLDTIMREIQVHYSKENEENLEIISWNPVKLN